MAEAVLKAELKKRKISWYSVQSAGLEAVDGAPMSEGTAFVLKEAKIPYSKKFKSRRLTKKMVMEAYAVVCMTQEQSNYLKIFHNVTSMYELSGREIPDPYGGGADIYRATLRAIQGSMNGIISGLGIRAQEE